MIKLPYRAPRSNAHCERWIGSVGREVLDHLPIFGCRHLEGVLGEYSAHYHHDRPTKGSARVCQAGMVSRGQTGTMLP